MSSHTFQLKDWNSKVKGDEGMHEAKYYEQLSDGRVHCELCPHQCIIPKGKRGICGVRVNDDGQLNAEAYAFITSASFDPIEKKPLYHFKPGKSIFSIGGKGCSFKCGFCQNAHIAMGDPAGEITTEEKLLEVMRTKDDNAGIAFTYNEPMVGFEFMFDMAKAAKTNGYSTVCVSNGFIMPDPLAELLPFIDAFNIDVKAFNDRFYHQVCRGERAPVMESVRRIAKLAHIELTLLLIEGENDDPEELEAMFAWIKDIDPNIPLHINRYYPHNDYIKEATPISVLLKAETLAKKYLNYVYLGNVPDVDRNTYCHKCGVKVIERSYEYTKVMIKGHVCHACGEQLPIKL